MEGLVQVRPGKACLQSCQSENLVLGACMQIGKGIGRSSGSGCNTKLGLQLWLARGAAKYIPSAYSKSNTLICVVGFDASHLSTGSL